MGRSIVTPKSLARQQAEAAPLERPQSSTRAGPGADDAEPVGALDISAPATPASAIDEYGDRLLKLIPAEVVTGYMAMDGILVSGGSASAREVWGIFAFGLFATWLYLQVFLKVESGRQTIISILAFAVWALNIGSGFPEWVDPRYAALLLIGFTMIAPKIPID